MKTLFSTLFLLMVSQSAVAENFDTSLLGSPSQYTCVVEIIQPKAILNKLIYQTCDTQSRNKIATVTTAAPLSVLQVEIISTMRANFDLVTMSTTDSDEQQTATLVFQKK